MSSEESKLTVRIDGADGNPDAESVLAIAQCVLDMLKGVEKSMYGENTIKWNITMTMDDEEAASQ